MVYDGKQPNIYVNGDLKLKSNNMVSKDNQSSTFNIGAGLDDVGWFGYNFKGEISKVAVFDRPLSEEEVKSATNGKLPEGKIIMNWENK